MEREAVDHEWRKQRERKRHKTVRQKKQAYGQMSKSDELHHITAFHQRAGKSSGSFWKRCRGLGDKIEKGIESKNEQRKSQQDPRNGGEMARE